MTWFVFALVCLLGWGFADMFYKKSSDETDRYSHLKIAVWVGLVMGITSFALIPFCETKMNAIGLLENAIKYAPASLCYIASMVVGYAGMRYLEISIISPVQNASGAFSSVVMFLYFMFIGKIGGFFEEFSYIDVFGTAIIVVGLVVLAIVEQRIGKAEKSKYRFGALALIFPLIYCLFDTLGTAADGIILDEEAGLGLGEIDVIVLYGLTFFLFGLFAWIFMLVKNKKCYNPFNVQEIKTKGTAALCEEFGQVFYVYAMASKPMLAAPMIASYCIVSVLLSRIFLKEKLKKSQYACVFAVIIGIVCLGISEGLE